MSRRELSDFASMPVDMGWMRKPPYFGSCHCGITQYIVFLSLPIVPQKDVPPAGMRIYKCNCSFCHKMGMFHLRLNSAPDDFALTSPTDPNDGVLVDYTAGSDGVHWYFCKTCGVRCFAFKGIGETVEVNYDRLIQGEKVEARDLVRKVWRPKKDGWEEAKQGVGKSFLSVNAMTLDPGQLLLDLREWKEKKWIWYKDVGNGVGEDRRERPHVGGCY